MKFCLIFILLSATIFGFSQTSGEVFHALATADTDLLASYFDREVELCFDDVTDFYTKKEAVARLNQFFASHHPSSCTELHEGTSKSQGSHYVIGKLITSNHNYRVYVYIDRSGSKSLIKEVRLNKI